MLDGMGGAGGDADGAGVGVGGGGRWDGPTLSSGLERQHVSADAAMNGWA